MERRVLVAIFLCFLVIYVWQALFVKPQPKRPVTTTAPAQAESAPSLLGPAPAAAAPTPNGNDGAATAPVAAALLGEPSERDIQVETADVIALFTNRGGRLKSWRLKHYTDQQKQPLELVVTELAGTQPLPFSLRVDDPAVTATINNAVYSVTAPPPGQPITAPADVTFEYRDTSGLHASKQFHFEPRSYVVSLHATVAEGDRVLKPTIVWGPALGDTEVVTRYGYAPRALFSAAGKEQRLAASSIAKQPTYENDFAWVGVDDHYFTTLAYHPGPVTVAYQAVSIPPRSGSKDPARALMAYSIEPAAADQTLKFYVGPKDFNELAAVDPTFVRAVDFGIFSFIVVPLLRSLKWIDGFVGNYGWSIIVLTVIINLIIFPLRHKSVVSMRKMQEIQPEVKAIQDRYAKLKVSDPARQKMNQELMELYKQRGVNPAAGCVPMLLPFPILLAFYSLLTTAIELRGAPFTLWVHDLAAPDPYYVMPVLMGASQLWQQWIMPAAGVDPVQRKMMMISPLIFTFLFITSPSGVAIYWLASNVWAIGQQYFTNYVIGPPTVRNVRPAAERRARRVGSGKTEAATKREE